MHVPKKAETHFTFVSKANMADPGIMVRILYYGSIEYADSNG